ncbi:MAG: ISNCY family transposase [Acidobacteriota bacterium]
MTTLIPMAPKEVQKLEIVRDIRAGRLSQREAATLLGVTDRAVRLWQRAYEAGGARGLVHGNRGRRSPQKLPAAERQRIVSLLRSQFPDFGPTLASEKLAEHYGIHRDAKTLWGIMVDERLWIPRRQRRGGQVPVHRQWRERRAHRGELVQFDGSYHDWFEGRGGLHETCLLAAIDDATGELLQLAFVPHEGVLPVMGFWTAYAGRHGLPKALYLDRFSTYKMNASVATTNHDLKTQLQRAMGSLGVDLVFALSPQAKGRVERLFKTLQDRLVKELRLAGICTVAEANRFLDKRFVPAFNRKYRVEPRAPGDLHRRMGVRDLRLLPETLCRVEQRQVMGDFTVSFQAAWHQLLPTAGLAIRPKDPVTVRQYPDASLSFSIRTKRVATKPIAKEPYIRRTRKILPTLVAA